MTHRTAKTLVDHATKEMARIYRRFLKDGRNLFINNRRVRPFDPTYRMEEATHASIAELAEKRSRLVQSWTIPIPLEEESEVTRDITVTLFILPIETWDQLSRKVLKNDLRVFEDTGVSFMRNGREVYMGPLAAITGKMGSKDPWWRLEIDFPATLDEAMGVAVNKQGVRLKAYVTGLIKKQIKEELSNVKSRIEQHWSTRATESAKAKAREAEQRANEAESLQSSLLPEPVMTEEYDKQIRELASGLKRNDETDDEASNASVNPSTSRISSTTRMRRFTVWNTSCERLSCGSTRRTPSLRRSTNPWRKLPSGLPTCGLLAARMMTSRSTPSL